MNVFLDSNILFPDPFFQGNFERNFIQTLERINGKLYLSDVVYRETINNYRREVKKRRKEYARSHSHFHKLMPTKPILVHETDEVYVQGLENYYMKLQESGILKIIAHNQFDIFSKIVDRAISNKKPFAEGREEFKDTVIWLTYSHYVEEMALVDCFFITNNQRDFYNTNNTGLHEDLLEDTIKIKGYVSIEKFMTEESELIKTAEEEDREEAMEEAYFEKLLELSTVVKSERYIKKLIETWLIESIDQEVSYYIDDLNEADREKLFPKYAVVYSGPLYKLEMRDNEREVYREEIIIFGFIEITHDVTMYTEKGGDEDSIIIGSKSLVHSIDFTFSLNAEEIPSKFEVKEILTKELNPEEF